MEFRSSYDRCDCHLLVAGNFESLRVRRDCVSSPRNGKRVPISFQTRKVSAAATWDSMLQDVARGRSCCNEKLGPRRREIFQCRSLPCEHTLVTAYLQTTLAPLFLDTGPPGAHSFAELILQRSLLTHAPPILA